MKNIGIISRTQIINNKEFIGCYSNYIKKLKDKANVFIIPNGSINEIKIMDALIAPGGDDISSFDREVLDYAIDNDIPYLGICLGMQLFGNKIAPIDNHYLKKHTVYIKTDSLLYKIYKTNELLVNSRHHDRVIDTAYNVSAISDDGVIEGIEVPNKKFIIGVQWHPEDLNNDSLFEYFINIL